MGFEPTILVFERVKTVHALDPATTVKGVNLISFGVAVRAFTCETDVGSGMRLLQMKINSQSLLINYAASSSGYIVSNGGVIRELETICKELVVA
jgi:hypothetical protein